MPRLGGAFLFTTFSSMKSLSAFLVFTILLSCNNATENRITDYTITEKDLIPEGLAFDQNTQKIYVSSTHKCKIVTIDKDGKVSDFIKDGQDDIKSVIGMEVDEKTNSLWAVSCEAPEFLPLTNRGTENFRSSIYHFNLADGKLIKKYSLNKDSVFLNDLTVADDGTVYITESLQSGVYCIKSGSDSLEHILDLKDNGFVNGISFTDKPGLLYVATGKGIYKIDLSTKQASLLPEASSLKATDIDGLSFHDNYFIGHQSTAVTRFYLSPQRDSIIKADTLNSGKEFNASTTGEVSPDSYYFIVNSQIQSGIDAANKKLKPLDSLTNIIIRKIKL